MNLLTNGAGDEVFSPARTRSREIGLCRAFLRGFDVDASAFLVAFFLA